MNPIPPFSRPRGGEPPPPTPQADDGGLLQWAPAAARREAEAGPGRRFWRWLFNGARPEPAPSWMGTVEAPLEGKSGICCSGGGIRSAAFSLGALQVLDREDELRRASYLAAVSGGSYIAAAISMVANTGSGNSDGSLFEEAGPFAPSSPEEQYLRNRSSYLAPTAADKAYLGIRIVLGLLFNLAFVSLPLIALALILTGFFYVPFVPDLTGPCRGAHCAANLPGWFWIAPLGVAGLAAACGLATLLFRWREERWERFFAAWSVRALALAAALALIWVGLPSLVDWLDHLAEPTKSVKPSLGDTLGSIGAGFGALLAGVIAQLGRVVISKGASETMGTTRRLLGKAGSGLATALAYLAGGLIGPLLLLFVVCLTIAVAMAGASKGSGVDWGLVGIGAALLAGFTAAYWMVDLTTWSLHPFYKRRLSSAFALKRVRPENLSPEERRRAEALAADAAGPAGIAIERDFDELVPMSETSLDATGSDGDWPTLLVCAAANISDSAATPPGRAVTGFTFSAHSAGGPLVGAVKMTQLERAFEKREEATASEASGRVAPRGLVARLRTFARMGPRRYRRRDLTLLAAVAMSGAAISPSMGKMTRRPLTFLMALANVRLGVWVPNPRWVAGVPEAATLPRRYARPRPWYLLCELLGLNRVSARYLYVTDGGHYENLGLVELLRRGCTRIYCFDASGVGKGRAEFDALGEAIALARSELGVEIDFGDAKPGDLTPSDRTHLARKDVVTGEVRFPGGLTGRLVYVRNTMTSQAPWDARAHQMADPRFPHNSTVDQLYTDQKFEAYRVLGAGAAERAVEAMAAA